MTHWVSTPDTPPGTMIEQSAVIEAIPPAPVPLEATRLFDPAVGWTTTTADEQW
jgi:hypothetical protein